MFIPVRRSLPMPEKLGMSEIRFGAKVFFIYVTLRFSTYLGSEAGEKEDAVEDWSKLLISSGEVKRSGMPGR